jgi:16S rRNA (guanine527-N7)-methyltransferase
MISKEIICLDLEQLGLPADDLLAEKLSAFIGDLVKWNKVYNLTAIREPEQILTQHIFDSLSVHPYLKGSRIIDVGTGGGFPGIPLAMLMPKKLFTLLDSNGKKTRFLQQMVINHGLANCDVVQSRAESFAAQFDVVICRAFAPLPDIVSFAGHLVSDEGVLLAMKGQLEESHPLAGDFKVMDIHRLTVPRMSAERHLVVLRRT